MTVDPVKVAECTVLSGAVQLPGVLGIPPAPTGIVIFAHGSGSSRFSSRNQFVAGVLNQGGLATLLFDLLTSEEHEVDQWTRELRFDIDLLTRRLTGAVDWTRDRREISGLAVGLFGASTGAAAALRTAAARSSRVAAVVSRGGRPDLAGAALSSVRAPTLLIVGGSDEGVIELNREAAGRLAGPREVAIISGATHLFEEPGTLERVAAVARDWFLAYLK